MTFRHPALCAERSRPAPQVWREGKRGSAHSASGFQRLQERGRRCAAAGHRPHQHRRAVPCCTSSASPRTQKRVSLSLLNLSSFSWGCKNPCGTNAQVRADFSYIQRCRDCKDTTCLPAAGLGQAPSPSAGLTARQPRGPGRLLLPSQQGPRWFDRQVIS